MSETDRRAHWTKQALNLRRYYLIDSGCDVTWAKTIDASQLVELCLIADGFGDKSKLGRRSSSRHKQQQLLDPTDKFLAFMQHMQRESAERERAWQERQETQRREDVIQREHERREHADLIERLMAQRDNSSRSGGSRHTLAIR